MMSRIALAILILAGLAGCGPWVGQPGTDLSAECLKDHPGDWRCCSPNAHVTNGTCCLAGEHAVSDVDHPDWRTCVPDEDPGDAGADAESDACADAP
jgi:hypothetical protein